MGRPKKNEIVQETDVTEQLKQENDTLRNELEAIKQMLLNMKNSNDNVVSVGETAQTIDSIQEEYVDIPINRLIKVMSLTNHKLNLTTQPKGEGKIKTFNKFGEVKNIVYSDLTEILNVHEKFAKEGKFYIMDKDVVRNHGLADEYENLLDKKTIENILTLEKSNIESIFSNATKTQKETVVSIYLNKIKNGEDVDLNKLAVISKIYGQDIATLARQNEDE